MQQRAGDLPTTRLGHGIMWLGCTFFGAWFTWALYGPWQWAMRGDLNDWLTSVGTLAAVVVALWLGKSQDRRIDRQRTAQAAVLAGYLLPELGVARVELNRISGWDETDQLSWQVDSNALRRKLGRIGELELSRVRAHLLELHVLPGGTGSALASAVGDLEQLQGTCEAAWQMVRDDDEEAGVAISEAVQLAKQLQERLRVLSFDLGKAARG